MSDRQLWYAHLGPWASMNDVLAVVEEIAPIDVGAETMEIDSNTLVFSLGAARIIARLEATLLLIETPNEHDAIGVAWSILVALSFLRPSSVWISTRSYGPADFAAESAEGTPMTMYGELGHVLNHSNFDRFTD